MKIITGFVDRILFTLGVIVFLQLPHFIDQYTQRLGGYYSSEKMHLDKYQSIADKNHNGDLNQLIKDFKKSNSKAVVQTGEEIEQIRIRVVDIKKGLDILENRNFIPKLVYLSKNMDYKLAAGTISVFKPGVPLTIEAIFCGVLGGIMFSLIYNGLIRLPGLILRKIFYSPNHQFLD